LFFQRGIELTGILGATTSEQQTGILVLLSLALAIALYFLWNIIVKKRRLHRVAYGDKQLYLTDRKKYHDELLNVFSSTPQVVGEIAGLTVASVLLAVTLLMDMQKGTFDYNVSLVALSFLTLGGLSYLFSMEQLTTLLSPSIGEAETFRLYEEAINLKSLGFFGLWAAVLTLMLLTSVYAVALASLFTFALVYRHYEARWVREKEKDLIYME
jgi:uncharacterized membrane protein YecN with MAPEG domain